MHLYRFSTGNPEGFDAFYVYTHEQLFSQEEFEAFAEEFLAESFEKTHKKEGFAAEDLEHVDNRFQEKGFKRIVYTALYDFEPYWNKKNIKSERLRIAIDLPDNYCKLCKREGESKETCLYYMDNHDKRMSPSEECMFILEKKNSE